LQYEMVRFHSYDQETEDRLVDPSNRPSFEWGNLIDGMSVTVHWPSEKLIIRCIVGKVSISESEASRIPEGTAPILSESPTRYVVVPEVFHYLHCLVSILAFTFQPSSRRICAD
jgi:hypothetical protein